MTETAAKRIVGHYIEYMDVLERERPESQPRQLEQDKTGFHQVPQNGMQFKSNELLIL